MGEGTTMMMMHEVMDVWLLKNAAFDWYAEHAKKNALIRKTSAC